MNFKLFCLVLWEAHKLKVAAGRLWLQRKTKIQTTIFFLSFVVPINYTSVQAVSHHLEKMHQLLKLYHFETKDLSTFNYCFHGSSVCICPL